MGVANRLLNLMDYFLLSPYIADNAFALQAVIKRSLESRERKRVPFGGQASIVANQAPSRSSARPERYFCGHFVGRLNAVRGLRGTGHPGALRSAEKQSIYSLYRHLRPFFRPKREALPRSLRIICQLPRRYASISSMILPACDMCFREWTPQS
jgi:hypothetical protein